MSRFSDISTDKNIILNKILSSQELCKAIYYNDTNFLDQPDIEYTSNLIYDRIFPFRFVPKVDADMKSYLTLSFRNYKPVNGSYKVGKIIVYVFTHRTLYRTDYGFLRTDYMLQKVDELLNDMTGISIGK